MKVTFISHASILVEAGGSPVVRALFRCAMVELPAALPASRRPALGEISLWRKIKRTAKGLLRRDERHLYDLQSWTEFDTTPALRRRLNVAGVVLMRIRADGRRFGPLRVLNSIRGGADGSTGVVRQLPTGHSSQTLPV
jgi:hypothetical protein